jgi:WD40 repeat protein
VTITAHDQPIHALALSDDGETLATASGDGVIRTWEWRDRTMLAEQKLPTTIDPLLLTFSPDGSRLAIGTDRDARLWSLTDPTQSSVLEVGSGGAGQILSFAPGGRYLLAGSRIAGLSLWNLESGVLAARLPDTQGENVSADFSPDGNLLVTTVYNGEIALWNLVQITAEAIDQSTLDIGTPRILYVEWTDDSRLLMFFDATGPVYLWGIPG